MDIMIKNLLEAEKPKKKKIWIPIIEPSLRPIVEKIYAKYPHITEAEIATIVKFQFKYVADKMREGNIDDFTSFNNTLLNELGTFYASEGKHTHSTKALKKKLAKLNKDNNECTGEI